MLKFLEEIPIYIETENGLVDIKDVVIGDRVYDFRSGSTLVVEKVIVTGIENIYKITFTDGREDYYSETESLYIDNGIIDICKLRPNVSIKQYEIDFKHLYNSLIPDPYIAGALLVHGDIDDQYINLPIDRISANKLFANKYQLDYGGSVTNNKTYFSWNGPNSDKCITWEEFFLHCIYEDLKKEIIPIEYRRSKIEDRWKFIQGVFDIGYTTRMFPNRLTIANPWENKLIMVQNILWSLGIVSTVEYAPHTIDNRDRSYRLDVHTPRHFHPRYFYDIDWIEDKLTDERVIKDRELDLFKLKIKSIQLITKGYTRKLIFDKPQVPFITKNYMSRVSV
jgi:hypothetical protein